MEIYNTSTGNVESVTYIQNGCDIVPDLLQDVAVRYNQELDRYEADSSTIAWWADYVERQEFSDDVLDAANVELSAELRDQLKEELEHVWCDFETGPDAVVATIESFMEEHGFSLSSDSIRPYFDKTN